ncbi:MAG: aspartyl protease family protein [Saprospiraceae bacterium]
MGLTHVNVTLNNSADVELHRRSMIGEDEIRSININCLVDTGAMTMIINDDIREALGLSVIGERLSQMADGRKIMLPLAGPIDIWYEDRLSTTNALVVSDNLSESVLGKIPLGEMDLWIHPATNRLTPIHPGEGPVMIVK